MKKYFATVLLLLCLSSSYGQRVFVYDDSSTLGHWTFIDTTKSCDELVKRLEGDWITGFPGNLHEISYSEEMFSIAAKKDSAIVPLMQLFNNTKRRKTKFGVIYTLHLIGINSLSGGRHTELFDNISAREALLSIMMYPEFHSVIISLLARDPRYSDIPQVFQALAVNDSDCSDINYYLSCFPIGVPIAQEIPENCNETIELYYTEVFSTHYSFPGSLILTAIAQKQFQTIYIDSLLLLPDRLNAIGSYAVASQDLGFKKNKVKDFLESTVNYRSPIQYHIENGHLYICTQSVARKRLLDWWNCMQIENPEAHYKNMSQDRVLSN